jgi:uncharacterized protein
LPEVISNTSPLQYLHQLGLLDLLPQLVGRITVPQAVVDELETGRALGHDLPEVVALGWVSVAAPLSATYVQPPELGREETDVLRLALESPAGDVVVIIDGARARAAASRLGLKLTGTLGVLLDAKRAGLILAVRPHLDRLNALGFRLARHTRAAVLRLAEEA